VPDLVSDPVPSASPSACDSRANSAGPPLSCAGAGDAPRCPWGWSWLSP